MTQPTSPETDPLSDIPEPFRFLTAGHCEVEVPEGPELLHEYFFEDEKAADVRRVYKAQFEKELKGEGVLNPYLFRCLTRRDVHTEEDLRRELQEIYDIVFPA